MPYYLNFIGEVLAIDATQARRVLAYLLLDDKRLSTLDAAAVRREYRGHGGIKAAIDADPAQADRLASSYGI